MKLIKSCITIVFLSSILNAYAEDDVSNMICGKGIFPEDEQATMPSTVDYNKPYNPKEPKMKNESSSDATPSILLPNAGKGEFPPEPE
jgi:hypothetical protein